MNWDISIKENECIINIAHRFIQDNPSFDYPRRDLIMDLTACIANGCPLDVCRLLKARDFDFNHDVLGVRQHINRRTGRLENGFWPRYTKEEGGL